MKLTRQQLMLLGIAALFCGPLFLVMLMRSSWWDYQPARLNNHGQLLQPPLQLTLADNHAIDGKWLLLYLLPETCERQCTGMITALRQIHTAAGRQRQQLTLVLLGASDPDPTLREQLLSLYPLLVFVTDKPAKTLARLSQIKPGKTSEAGGSGERDRHFDTFIVDPDQRVILAYNAEHNPNDINTDLKRLLKWSKQDTMP